MEIRVEITIALKIYSTIRPVMIIITEIGGDDTKRQAVILL